MVLDSTNINKYGSGIKIRLIELGMTQKELANIVGIDAKHLSKIVTGKKKGWKYRDKIDDVLKNTTSRRIKIV